MLHHHNQKSFTKQASIVSQEIMSPKVDMGPCLGLHISDTLTKYIPVKIFVISNSPWGAKKPEHPINFQINAACFLIKHRKYYSELSVGWSGFLLMWSEALELLLNPFLCSPQTGLLGPGGLAYKVPNEACSIWQYFCLLFLETFVLQIAPNFKCFWVICLLLRGKGRGKQLIFCECLLNSGYLTFSLSFKSTRALLQIVFLLDKPPYRSFCFHFRPPSINLRSRQIFEK